MLCLCSLVDVTGAKDGAYKRRAFPFFVPGDAVSFSDGYLGNAAVLAYLAIQQMKSSMHNAHKGEELIERGIGWHRARGAIYRTSPYAA